MNHSIKKNREIRTQNRGTKLEKLSLKTFLISSSTTLHRSDSLKHMGNGEKVDERR
jgi:hypothetical protein